MPEPTASSSASLPAPSRRFRWRRWLAIFAGVYLLIAYLLAPAVWELVFHSHPTLDDDPRLTTTSDGHPGDPLNVALIGTQDELHRILLAAGWKVAAKLGLESDLKIAADTVLSRPDVDAPVSKLFLYGRAEDFAFERPVGDNPRQRHHVRFWKTGKPAADDRPVWIGSASYDERVGLSHTTGQVTHHIDGKVDAERDFLFSKLRDTGELAEEWPLTGFHSTLTGRNGGGDEWKTDGTLLMGEIAVQILSKN